MQVNGQSIPCTPNTTLLQFLEQQGYRVERVVVELNGEIPAKSTYAEIVLQETDVVEVVQFMGGG